MSFTPRLPQLDPAAKSPRGRGYIPGAEENPYIPHMRSRSVDKASTPRMARTHPITGAEVEASEHQVSNSVRTTPRPGEVTPPAPLVPTPTQAPTLHAAKRARHYY